MILQDKYKEIYEYPFYNIDLKHHIFDGKIKIDGELLTIKKNKNNVVFFE